MKVLISGLFWMTGLLFILTGCFKDKGNYDYIEPNAIEITTDMDGVDPTEFITADSIEVRQNSNLKVRLKVNASQGDVKQFTYQWYVTQYTQSNANPPYYLIGNTAELDTKITLPVNLYKLVAKVTDTGSGLSFYKYFALNVSVADWGGEGWVVLHESDGGSDISVITTRDGSIKGNVYNDIYSSVNGHKLPVGTYKVNVINYVTALRAQKVSFLYPNGALQVRSFDFADSLRSDGWFAALSGNTNFQSNGSAGGTGAGWEYVIVNNRIAYRQFASALHVANPPLFFPPYEGLSIAPFVINASGSDNFYTLYDNVNRAFTLFNASTSLHTNIANNYSPPVANLDPITGSGFDMKNIGDNLIYAENAEPINKAASIYWNCFFRNDDGDKTYLIQFPRALTYANNFIAGRYQLNESNCPGINSATLFANPTFMSMPGGVFYYVNGHQIYSCKINALAGSVAQPNLTFAPGTIIKAMKVFNSGYTIANISAFSVPEGRVLVVATDESASGKGHNIYFFNIDTQSGLINGTPESPADSYTGFQKISDIVFKKALGR
ncbi:PKD-like family lipoprotein [Sphingobacterium lumbrici]|uniref:PKD-like family lipoprotein n=1 Tax=Sphingobacterium lumbrici TaxID=2559600 RepID=UPI0015E3AC99|nr:PKD-like family lipoprotein [Sphingobacterium lumbrici]